MRRTMGLFVTAAMACALVVTTQSTALAAPKRGGTASTNDSAFVAVQRDLGLTAAQARALSVQQDKAVQLDASLRTSLGSTFGGSWFDDRTGKLVVNVTDAAGAAEVTKAGARATVVRHSESDLDAIVTELNTLSGKAPGAERTKAGKSGLTGLAGWHVDPRTNSVVVTVVTGQQPAVLGSLTRYGDAVRYEYTARAPQATQFMDGGDEIDFGNCSAGFNLRNPSTGQGYLLTAGHCETAGNAVYGQGGVFFGTVLESFFPTFDDSLIRADNPGSWTQGPWVDLYPSNGDYIPVSGYSDSLVGTFVCKSGITTKWSCGHIRAKDETVTYSGGQTVYGLTRHSSCVEPGDSGGANVALTSSAAWSAEGVTSGAQLYWDGSRYRCAAAVNAGDNVSWYFPIADSLAYYGPKYGLGMW